MNQQRQPDSTGPKRQRNAAATRKAILDSAIRAFTEHGYDGIGVREIARDAGVTAMLVNRYFGSKEKLFAEAVDASFAPATVIREDSASLAATIARRLVERTDPDAEALDPFLLLLRSAPNPRAAEIMRASTERHAGHRLAELLDGPDPERRAALANSLIAGFWLMRTVLQSTALTDTDPADLTTRLERAFDALLSPTER
ncbi:TetR/AcrR family transcriptional regulator [Actinoallomurus iriomotensis]|uniref:TetR family transcriptional regulator n=1 Tax=Actinoallomurus iriomotensis TaxID=478107 RepID=A0A9W6VS60_9ACTN|nr:TetR/AcrR family transcriptional regulator [Actinoallomurus iriomotensis]GLY78350.1 TetR family transcriptional regulator [Actinoallomurus iriomotensis]